MSNRLPEWITLEVGYAQDIGEMMREGEIDFVVSEGTDDEAELIVAMRDHLKELDPGGWMVIFEEYHHYGALDADGELVTTWDETGHFLLLDLMTALGECAPEDAYFGPINEDSDCYGFWREPNLEHANWYHEHSTNLYI